MFYNMHHGHATLCVCFTRMEFEDFCHYFTDMVVCRLVERYLFWHWGHWRETHCTGEWTHAPLDSTRPTASRSSHTQKVSSSAQWSPPATALRGDRKEEKLSERQLHERRDHRVKEKKTGPTQRGEGTTKGKENEFQGKEKRVVDESWEHELDKRSRCGGCINHRETFLHNPQVALPSNLPFYCSQIQRRLNMMKVRLMPCKTCNLLSIIQYK